jgi:hypothetical protein
LPWASRDEKQRIGPGIERVRREQHHGDADVAAVRTAAIFRDLERAALRRRREFRQPALVERHAALADVLAAGREAQREQWREQEYSRTTR